MIGYIEGRVMDEGPDWMVVLAGQVGYQVYAPLSALPSTLGGREEVRLHISTQVVDELPTLFGFQTREEKELFEALLTVSGVGPKAALKLMSVPISLLVNAISDGDAAVVCSVKGIGKKTAERVILELRDKVSVMGLAACVESESGAEARRRSEVIDALEALRGLGFSPREAAEAVNGLGLERLGAAGVDEIISAALSVLGQGKGGE